VPATTNHILRENTPHRREAALTHLAVKERVSAFIQNQALSALLFLYRHVIGRERRITMFSESLKTSIQDHLKKVKTIHERDVVEGWGRVEMPGALDRKYPNAPYRVAMAMGLPSGKSLEEHKDRHGGATPRS